MVMYAIRKKWKNVNWKTRICGTQMVSSLVFSQSRTDRMQHYIESAVNDSPNHTEGGESITVSKESNFKLQIQTNMDLLEIELEK